MVPFFSPFFFSSFLFFLYYSLSRPRPSSSFYCFSRRRQTVANRIRGPLFTRSPVTLCLLLTNFGRSFLSLHLSLFLFPQPSPLINGNLATYDPLLSRDRVLIAAVTANNSAQLSGFERHLSFVSVRLLLSETKVIVSFYDN